MEKKNLTYGDYYKDQRSKHFQITRKHIEKTIVHPTDLDTIEYEDLLIRLYLRKEELPKKKQICLGLGKRPWRQTLTN